MPFSYNSHSGQFCQFGKGHLESCVLRAIEIGYAYFGMSESMPRYKEEQLYKEEAKKTVQFLQENFEKYIREARRLQHHYKEHIKLLVGMETFYFGADSIQDINDSRQHFNPDYVVGMVRHIRGIPIDINNDSFTKAEEAVGNTEELFCEYFDCQYELVTKTHPEVVGKFDLIYTFRKNFELTEVIWEKIDRNIRYIAEYGGLFEINSKALTTELDDPYPQRHILRRIIALGGHVTLSDGSYGPTEVGMFYSSLQAYIESMNIQKIHFLAPTIFPRDRSTPIVNAKPMAKSSMHVLQHAFWRDSMLFTTC
ncbi:uncharacterized protein TRIADDRAFT_25985 [Trichoplax adhaerens]|uniref:histidinol-phosphatase n=1 Tax=Trichoplax adhaerens TaxID=10228 RepID=B3RWH6_TRIAD|nr:hypothetical protein TRIADDRAFT_25985 [Trichoplax adhaerens]EDV25137.1 hypothetical protein TRIADDRAFT_25985 [Trichoplax adhaerens]|eukprot:XP_002113027.1 hypothetical protein TRIADDRAFT_25985 [Trichoplax adhaerens]